MFIKSNVFKKTLGISFLILILISAILTICFSSPKTVQAESKWEPLTNVEEEAKSPKNGVFAITSNDVKSIWNFAAWATNQQTFIFTRQKSDGSIERSFNTPNLPKQIYNMILSMIPSGWMGYMNEYKSEYESNEWTTALKKYGYNLPENIYVGENPATLIDLYDLKNSMTGGVFGINTAKTAGKIFFSNLIQDVGSFFSHLFSGEDVKFETQLADTSIDDIRSIYYSTADYTEAGYESTNVIAQWLQDNWDTMSKSTSKKMKSISVDEQDKKSIFEEGQIINSGETVGGDPGQVTGKNILERIQQKQGSTSDELLQLLYNTARTECNIDPPELPVLRQMPYDIDTMSHESKTYIGGVGDPRTNMYKTAGGPFGIGVALKYIMSKVVYWIPMNLTKWWCQLAAGLNKICSFDWVRSSGIDPFFLWKNFGLLIIVILSIALIVILVRNLIVSLKSGISSKWFAKLISTLLIVFISIGILTNPDKAGNMISDVISNVMNLGTTALNGNDQFRELHTDDANHSDVSDLRFWALYFNAWSLYATNVSMSDSANKFDTSQGTNEYIKLNSSPATLKDGKSMPFWSVVLLDDLSQNDYNGAMRVVDHFMAPRITDTGYPNFKVENNPNYTGDMYSAYPGGISLIALSVLLVTILKVLCFAELILDLALLFFRLCNNLISGLGNKASSGTSAQYDVAVDNAENHKILSSIANGGSSLKDTIGTVCGDVGRIIAYDFIITLIIFITYSFSQVSSLLFGVLLIVGSIRYYVWLWRDAQGDFILMPQLFLLFRTAIRNFNHWRENRTPKTRLGKARKMNRRMKKKMKDMELNPIKKKHKAKKARKRLERKKQRRESGLNNFKSKGKGNTWANDASKKTDKQRDKEEENQVRRLERSNVDNFIDDAKEMKLEMESMAPGELGKQAGRQAERWRDMDADQKDAEIKKTKDTVVGVGKAVVGVVEVVAAGAIAVFSGGTATPVAKMLAKRGVSNVVGGVSKAYNAQKSDTSEEGRAREAASAQKRGAAQNAVQAGVKLLSGDKAGAAKEAAGAAHGLLNAKQADEQAEQVAKQVREVQAEKKKQEEKKYGKQGDENAL